MLLQQTKCVGVWLESSTAIPGETVNKIKMEKCGIYSSGKQRSKDKMQAYFTLKNKHTKRNDSRNGNDLTFAPRTYFGFFMQLRSDYTHISISNQTYKGKWLFSEIIQMNQSQCHRQLGLWNTCTEKQEVVNGGIKITTWLLTIWVLVLDTTLSCDVGQTI